MVYDWKKTVRKFGWSLAFVLVSGAVSIAAGNPAWIFLVPVLEATRNLLKHKFELAWL